MYVITFVSVPESTSILRTVLLVLTSLLLTDIFCQSLRSLSHYITRYWLVHIHIMEFHHVYIMIWIVISFHTCKVNSLFNLSSISFKFTYICKRFFLPQVLYVAPCLCKGLYGDIVSILIQGHVLELFSFRIRHRP